MSQLTRRAVRLYLTRFDLDILATPYYLFMNCAIKSMGSGNIIVEFFSADIVFSVWRYRSCRAAGDWAITSAASFNALADFCSPSAAITYSNSKRQWLDLMARKPFPTNWRLRHDNEAQKNMHLNLNIKDFSIHI